MDYYHCSSKLFLISMVLFSFKFMVGLAADDHQNITEIASKENITEIAGNKNISEMTTNLENSLPDQLSGFLTNMSTTDHGDDDDGDKKGGGGGGGASQLQCVQKLLPCQPHLKNTSNPPDVCCGPLKEMVANQSECLCTVLKDSDLLKSFNVTVEDTLKLAKACGADADPKLCGDVETSPVSSLFPSPKNDTSSDSSTEDSKSASPPASKGQKIPELGGLLVLGFILASAGPLY